MAGVRMTRSKSIIIGFSGFLGGVVRRANDNFTYQALSILSKSDPQTGLQ
jgi:hypothetical protein